MPEEHSSVVGGSTAHRILACPGSRELMAAAPPQPSSSYAIRGTAMHNAMEAMILSHLNDGEEPTYPMDYREWTCPETGHTLEPEDAIDGLAPAWDAFQENVMKRNPRNVLLETRATWMLHEGAFGTIDVFAELEDAVIVWDWKFGHNAVSPIESPQLQFYAAAAMLTPHLEMAFKPGAPVELWICQPATSPVAQCWTTDITQLVYFSNQLQKALARNDLNTGKHCKWCPAAITCPKLNAVASGAAATSPDDSNIDELLSLANVLDDWIKEVRAYAHKCVEGGQRLDSWKLVDKVARRQWVDEEKAAEALLTLDCQHSDLYTQKLLTPAQAEKLVGKGNLPGELVKSVSSGTTLVSRDDKRPEVETERFMNFVSTDGKTLDVKKWKA